MAQPGPPLDWADADLDQQSAVTAADIKAVDAYVARMGAPLLRALYGAAPYVPPEDERG